MKATSALVLSVVLGVVAVEAQEQAAVRPMDAGAAEACEHGRASSPAFRVLLGMFDPARVVVHVVSGEVPVFGTTGATRLVGAAGGWRYLRITLDPNLPLDERTAVLGHELQHAREIAGTSAATQRQVRQLYERIGRPVNGATDAFETTDAVDAGARVWRDLRTAAARTRALARAAKMGHEAAAPAAVRAQ